MACTYEVSGQAFIGCPRDAEAFQDALQRIWHDLPVPGQRPALIHWRKDYDPVASPGAEPDQFKIARTSDPATNPVFILFAHTIGTPVRPPATGWEKLRRWLDTNGWPFIALLGEANFTDPNDPPDGSIPLSGTIFELFDALRTGSETDLRVYDLSRIAAPLEPLSPLARRQEVWCAHLLTELGKSHAVRSPATEAEFEQYARRDLREAFGLSPLDPFTDRLPGLEPIDDQPLLFGRDGLVDAMNRRVFQDGAACVPVLGVSGAGKSSFLRAGLIRTWFRHSPAGPGLRFPTHAFLFEPDLLALTGNDPLEVLGRLLTSAPGSSGARVIGPLPGPLTAVPPELPPATGDPDADLRPVVTWWQGLTGGLPATTGEPHRIILVCDQAEQIDARARRQAQDQESRTGLPATPVLDPAWRRFTAFLGLLAGLQPLDDMPRHAAEFLAGTATSVRCQLILGLHRLSALKLWPIAHASLPTPFEVSPLVNQDEWQAVIEGTCRAYNLRPEPDLREAMVTEACELGTEHQPIKADVSARIDTRPTAASVLPQVRVALQRIMTAWRYAHRGKAALTEQDRVLDLKTYEPLRSIEHSIECLGEDAWRDWQNRLAAHHGLDTRGFLEARTLAEESVRRFGDLLSGLVDARDDGYQDLTLLPGDHPRAKRQNDLVEALRRQRLLTTTEVTWQASAEPTQSLRLPHRSVLDHWSRARQWVAESKPRLDAKDRLRAVAKLKLPAAQWPEELVAPFADLALNWIGTGEGADRTLIDYLQTGLAVRLNPEEVDVRAHSQLGILPFAVMVSGDLVFAKRLLDRCAGHPSWPGKAGAWLTVSAERGSSALLEAVLSASRTPAQIVNWVNDQTGNFPLLQAAQNGHDAVVAHLLKHGAMPNQVNDQNGAFPLLQAAQEGHDAVVARLLEHGALPNQINDQNSTFALLMAAQEGHDAVVARLLEHGALPNQVDDQTGTFPLLLAAQNGHDAVVARLLEHGALPNQVDDQTGTFPLLLAAQEGHDAVVAHLLEHGAMPDQVNDQTGTFPLLQAAQNGHDAVVARLLKHGALPDQVYDQSGTFPLLQAAQNGHDAVVARLLEHGALPKQINDQTGTFPLLQAAQNGHDAVVAHLLEHGAPPDQVNDQTGTFPLVLAAQNGHDAVVARLLEHGALPNQVNQNGTFPLLQAAQNGRDAVVARLLEHGALPNQVNGQTGTFPLLLAAENGRGAVVARLLEHGALPNQVNDQNGTFPLLQAAQNGRDAVVVHLLEHGAPPDQVNDQNGTFPLLQAAQNGHDAVVARLLRHSAMPDQVNDQNSTFALLLAAQNGHDAVVARLLKHGAMPNQVNDQNSTFALLLAAQNGHDAVVARLLEHGALPNQVDDQTGTFPLLQAAQNGHDAVVARLLKHGAAPRQTHAATGATALTVALGGFHAGVIRRLAIAEGGLNDSVSYLLAQMERLPRPHVAPPVSLDNNSRPLEPGGMPIPGPWETVAPDERQRSGLAAIFAANGTPAERFKGLIEMKIRPLLSRGRLDLVRARFALAADRLLAVEASCLIGAALPPIPLASNLDFDAVQRSLAARRLLPDLRLPEMQQLLAALFLLSRPSPLIPLLAEAPLPLPPGTSAPPISYPDGAWRSWSASTGPEGPQVRLPWFDRQSLVEGGVLVPPDGLGLRVLDNPQTLARGLQWTADRFLRVDGRATGLWVLGEVQQ
jgi:ankyrin repeat protein